MQKRYLSGTADAGTERRTLSRPPAGRFFVSLRCRLPDDHRPAVLSYTHIRKEKELPGSEMPPERQAAEAAQTSIRQIAKTA
jgi:hypothetical protein